MSSKKRDNLLENFKDIDDMIEDGDYQEAKIQIKKELDKVEISEAKTYLEIFLCKLLRLNGGFREVIKNLEKIESAVFSINNSFLTSFFLTEIAWSCRLSGETERASKYVAMAEEEIKQIDPNSEYYKYKIIQFKAIVLHNKAVILLETETTTHALFTAYESLKFREQLGHNHGIADALNNIGVMHWYNGELDLAAEQLGRCYLLSKEIGNPMLSALVLLNLVQLNVQRGSKYIETALNYYKEFEEFKESETNENKQIENYFLFAKAVYLKSSNRFKHRAEAEKIFYDLIENDGLDGLHVMYAYYYLADILLYELKTTGDQDILHELTTLVDNLSQMGEEKNMKVASSRSHLLRSKLKVINGDIDGAKYCMNLALNLALEGNDNRLLYTITHEYDDLFKKEDDVLQINDETPFQERIEIAQIEQLVSQLNQRGSTDDDDDTERPILFMIMMDVGTLVYSKSFGESSVLNENLVSNFIGAINNFGNEVFSSSGFLERINHKDYTILMKSTDVFIFSYVFKGSSYAPSKKLNEIANQINNLNVLTGIQREPRIVTMNQKVKNQINSLINNVILSES